MGHWEQVQDLNLRSPAYETGENDHTSPTCVMAVFLSPFYGHVVAHATIGEI